MASLGNKAIASGFNVLIEEFGAQNVKNVSEQLLGNYLAVYAFLYGKRERQLTDKQIIQSIKQAKLKVRVDDRGNVTKSEVMSPSSISRAVGRGWQVDHCKPRAGAGRSIRTAKSTSGRFANKRGGRGGWAHYRSIFPNTHVREVPESQHYEVTEKATDPVVIQSKQGNTTYIIQNLNIYLTADVVNQLNLNPKEVINIIQDQLKEQIEKGK